MDTLDSKLADKDFVKDFKEKQRKYLNSMCLKCHLYPRDISGVCRVCQDENRRK